MYLSEKNATSHMIFDKKWYFSPKVVGHFNLITKCNSSRSSCKLNR